MKKKSQSTSIINRRARFDYSLGDEFVVGIVLNGRETKSLRLGHGDLSGAHVTIKNDELWLTNASIHGTKGILIEDTEVTRSRKLLAKHSEIEKIAQAKAQGNTVIPLEILTRGRFIKVRIAVGKGKRQFDKRQTIKKRDDDRDAQREMRQKWR